LDVIVQTGWIAVHEVFESNFADGYTQAEWLYNPLAILVGITPVFADN
jgi:hypothetical protein